MVFKNGDAPDEIVVAELIVHSLFFRSGISTSPSKNEKILTIDQ